VQLRNVRRRALAIFVVPGAVCTHHELSHAEPSARTMDVAC
jgi:hypothetical protein